MRASRRFLTPLAASIGVAALAVAAGSPASGVTTPGWRIVTTVGSSSGDWGANLTVDSATDAWSVWNATGSSSLEHSTGSAWQRTTVPASIQPYVTSSVAIGASSAANLWLFGNGTTSVARLTNGKWSIQSVPTGVEHINLSGELSLAPEVFSPTNVWVFSLGVDAFTNPDHYVSRYNGSTWSRLTLPLVPSEVDALSSNDIWVLGVPVALTKNVYLISHWDGTKWTTVAAPAVKPPAGALEGVSGLAATGSGDAWVTRWIEQGTQGAQTLYLLHLHGTTWTKVSLGFPTSNDGYLAQDGSGGIWMAANGPGPSYTPYFDHLSGGHWARYAVPVPSGSSWSSVLGLSWIPGTTSLWAPEQAGTSTTATGLILKYGA